MEPLSAVGLKLADRLVDWLRGSKRATVLTHHGAMISTGERCVFVNVTNRSHDRDIEITHIGFDTDPPIEVINAERPLPRRLKPEESWETWLPIEVVPGSQRLQILTLGRVRFSDGTMIRARENRNVPAAGHVPGP
jgi:hypothetical protein